MSSAITWLAKGGASMAGLFLHRECTIAPPGYSRWLMPPAALCVHLCHCARSRQVAVSFKA